VATTTEEAGVTTEVQRTRWDEWGRWAPLAAIGTVILWGAGFFTVESAEHNPDEGTGAEAVIYFQEDAMNIYLGSVLLMGGSLLLIWFVSTLRSRIAGGFASRLGSVVFGAGLAIAMSAMALPAAQVGGAFLGEEDEEVMEPAAAQALFYATDGFFIAAMYASALLVLATTVAILSGRLALPRWLGWAGILLGIWLLIAPIGWLALVFVFPVWLILVAVLLLRAESAPAQT
jgi:hypothetical protein